MSVCCCGSLDMSLNNNIEMNPTSYRYLVVDFINYRLGRHGYTWDNCPPLQSRTDSVHRTLRALGDEFEERFRTQFDDMVNQLHITPNTAYPTFHQVVQELFIDGVNWGRIVALFGFGGAIAVDCVNKEMPHLVDSIVDWVSTYVENNLDQWITSSGGWDGFVEFYENGHSQRQESPWDNISGVIKYGMLGAIGAMALGAILTQRT